MLYLDRAIQVDDPGEVLCSTLAVLLAVRPSHDIPRALRGRDLAVLVTLWVFPEARYAAFVVSGAPVERTSN
jgi:hypothetical protein